MKLIQMQYSPDAFDSFVKGKLDEVGVDTASAQTGWQQFSQNPLVVSAKKSGTVRFYVWAGITIGAILILFLLLQSNNGRMAHNMTEQKKERSGVHITDSLNFFTSETTIKDNQSQSKITSQLDSVAKDNDVNYIPMKNPTINAQLTESSNRKKFNNPLVSSEHTVHPINATSDDENFKEDTSAAIKKKGISLIGFLNRTDTTTSPPTRVSNPPAEKKKKKVSIIW